MILGRLNHQTGLAMEKLVFLRTPIRWSIDVTKKKVVVIHSSTDYTPVKLERTPLHSSSTRINKQRRTDNDANFQLTLSSMVNRNKFAFCPTVQCCTTSNEQ